MASVPRYYAFIVTGKEHDFTVLATKRANEYITLLNWNRQRKAIPPPNFPILTRPSQLTFIWFRCGDTKNPGTMVGQQTIDIGTGLLSENQVKANNWLTIAPNASPTRGDLDPTKFVDSPVITTATSLSIASVYKSIRFAPPGKVISLEIFSHGFFEGPVLNNTYNDSVDQKTRGPTDTDGRLFDFNKNMGIDPSSEPASVQSTAQAQQTPIQFFINAFISGGFIRVWGCNIQDVVLEHNLSSSPAVGAEFSGTIAGTTLTVNSVPKGTISDGQDITRVDDGSYVGTISSPLPGTGGANTYLLKFPYTTTPTDQPLDLAVSERRYMKSIVRLVVDEVRYSPNFRNSGATIAFTLKAQLGGPTYDKNHPQKAGGEYFDITYEIATRSDGDTAYSKLDTDDSTAGKDGDFNRRAMLHFNMLAPPNKEPTADPAVDPFFKDAAASDPPSLDFNKTMPEIAGLVARVAKKSYAYSAASALADTSNNPSGVPLSVIAPAPGSSGEFRNSTKGGTKAATGNVSKTFIHVGMTCCPNYWDDNIYNIFNQKKPNLLPGDIKGKATHYVSFSDLLSAIDDAAKEVT